MERWPTLPGTQEVDDLENEERTARDFLEKNQFELLNHSSPAVSHMAQRLLREVLEMPIYFTEVRNAITFHGHVESDVSRESLQTSYRDLQHRISVRKGQFEKLEEMVPEFAVRQGVEIHDRDQVDRFFLLFFLFGHSI